MYPYIEPKIGQMSLKRARLIVSRIKLTGPWFERWSFVVKNFNGTNWQGQDFYLQVRAKDKDNVTGADAEWGGRKFHISNYATDSEVVLTAWKAIHTAIEHEARENFLYDDTMLFDPHMDILNLAEDVKRGMIGQDVRENPTEVFVLAEPEVVFTPYVDDDRDFILTPESVSEYIENLTTRMGSM